MDLCITKETKAVEQLGGATPGDHKIHLQPVIRIYWYLLCSTILKTPEFLVQDLGSRGRVTCTKVENHIRKDRNFEAGDTSLYELSSSREFLQTQEVVGHHNLTDWAHMWCFRVWLNCKALQVNV